MRLSHIKGRPNRTYFLLDPPSITMISSIFEAVGNGDLNQLRKTIALHKIIDDNWTDYELLIASLNQDNKDVIKLLLNNGCRVQHESKNGFVDSPLYCAISKQDLEILEILLNKVCLSSIDYKSESVFESISKSSHEKIKLILRAYTNQSINPPDYDGFTPFHLACYIGDLDLVKEFLKLSCDPDSCIHADAKSFAGYSALHFAVESKCVETVDLLLQVCRDITVKDLVDKSALHLACEKRLEPVIDLFTEAYSRKSIQCQEDQQAFRLLHANLCHEDLAFCPRLCSADSWTLLHFAVARQRYRPVELLLDNDDTSPVDVADEHALPALHLACRCAFRSFYEATPQPLHHEHKSADEQDAPVEIVRLLLTRGSDPNAADGAGRTALFHVLESFKRVQPSGTSQLARPKLVRLRTELVDLLLAFGARVDSPDEDGTTPLHQLSDSDAVFHEKDKLKLAQRVLSLGADVNARTRRNVSPLFLAIRNKFTDLAKLYVASGADVNCACSYFNKFTPLHALPYYNEYNYESTCLLRQLLQRGADVNASETDSATALHIAVDCHGLEGGILDDRDEMAAALLDHGADVDALDRHRQTPLHRACLNRYDKGATVLLDRGADVNLEDEFGHSPLDYAGYRVQQESSPAFFFTVRHHVHRLRFIGARVSSRNQHCLQELEKFYAHRFKIPKIDDFLRLCAREVASMRACKLDNYTTLYDILLKSANDMTRHVKNEEFARVVRSRRHETEFKIYGYLLLLQYQRGLKRAKLMQPAQTSLTKALGEPEGPPLPDTPVNIIFEHLSDADLQSLIQAY